MIKLRKKDFGQSWRLHKLISMVLLDIIFLIQFTSCQIKRNGYPMVFRNGYGVLHNDIVLQCAPNILTEYSSGAMLHIVSTWTMNGDTITAIPKIEYGSRNGIFWFHPIDRTDSTVTSIRKTYIMKGNVLKEITDYTPIFRSVGLLEADDSEKHVEFFRVK